MNLSDIAFVPSVQHTGTWFTLDFLKRFIPRTKELTFLLEADDMKPTDAGSQYKMQFDRALDVPTIVHVHFPIVRSVGSEIDFFGSVFDQTWMMNLATKRALPIQFLLLICNFFKTVIPVRDPIAAILTRETRHPQFRHFGIVDGYVAMATEFARHPNVKFLPIDMARTSEQRKQLLSDVLIHCSIDPGPHEAILDEMAVNWPVSNPTPGNRLKGLYDSGKFGKLRNVLGPKYAEIEYAKNMASIILPWLGELGYGREQVYKGI
jgi:hypothetical protein